MIDHVAELSALAAPNSLAETTSGKIALRAGKKKPLIPNCMANEQARNAAAAEAIFVRDGVALEGTHTNLFAVFRGVVRTSPLTNYILPGVTRAVVLELCSEAGFEVAEEPIFADELHRADEVFIVGTTAEVTPIIDLDGRAIGSGRAGEISLRLAEMLTARARGRAVGSPV